MLTTGAAGRFGAALLLSALAACGSPAARPPEQVSTTSKPDASVSDAGELSDRALPRRLRLRLGGAEAIRFDGEVEMRVVTRIASGDLRPFSVVHVGPRLPIDLGDGRVLMFEIGLVGAASAEGVFEIPAGVGTPPPGYDPGTAGTASGAASSVAAVSVLDGDRRAERRFAFVRDACTVELASEATVGRARCPALLATSGAGVSFELEWSAP